MQNQMIEYNEIQEIKIKININQYINQLLNLKPIIGTLRYKKPD